MNNTAEQNRVALVIGVGSPQSIGTKVAESLALAGVLVVAADIKSNDDEKYEFLARQYTMDASNEGSVSRVLRAIYEDFERLDYIVNSAGVNYLGPTHEYPLEAFLETQNANLVSNFLLLKHYRAIFGGDGNPKNYVAVTSDTAMIPKSSSAAYASSKAGANQLIRSVAREYNKYSGEDWLVTALAPGRVATDMDSTTIADLATQRDITPEEAEQMLSTNIPVGRAMAPDEAADWVTFLLDRGRFASGNVIRVDGGQVQG